MPKTKAQKREEAEERREDYDTLKPEDQLTLLHSRPGASKKERAKLLSRIDKRGKVNKGGGK